VSTRLLGLECSPRDNSNSGVMLRSAFERLDEKYPGECEHEVVSLRDLHMEPCKACNVCGKRKDTGAYIPCVRAEEDDVQSVIDKMIAADGLLVATPVYFGLPSDLFSKFIMRTRTPRHQDFKLANKPVGVLAPAGRRSGGAETAIIATWLPFVRNGCLVVGNGDGTCQFGAYGWAGARGHIVSDEWGLEQSFQTAERVYTLAAVFQAGVEASGFVSPMVFSYGQGTRA